MFELPPRLNLGRSIGKALAMVNRFVYIPQNSPQRAYGHEHDTGQHCEGDLPGKTL